MASGEDGFFAALLWLFVGIALGVPKSSSPFACLLFCLLILNLQEPGSGFHLIPVHGNHRLGILP